MMSIENGCAYSATNSQVPRSTKRSISSSAARHMNSSFSWSRIGDSWRIMSPRWAVCSGGSKVMKFSLKAKTSRYCSISADTSSRCGPSGRGGNGPAKALHEEKVSWSRNTARISS